MGIFDFLRSKKCGNHGLAETVMQCDYEAAENLRGKLSSIEIGELQSLYGALTDWSHKDVVIHMLQDVNAHGIESILIDGLRSPNVETEAICLCCLYPDKVKFEKLLQDGRVSKAHVEEAKLSL